MPRCTLVGLIVLLGAICYAPANANGKFHADATTSAAEAAGFSRDAQVAMTVGGLATEVQAAVPGVLQHLTDGPWASEAQAFQFSNLLPTGEVRAHWDNIDSAAHSASETIAGELKQNKCSALACDGHPGQGSDAP